jgi:hypothetical protein
MWQRVDVRGVDGEYRIEQVRQPNPMRFRDQPEGSPITVEAPRPAMLSDFEPGLVVPIKELVLDLALGCLVRQLDRARAEPLDCYDRR